MITPASEHLGPADMDQGRPDVLSVLGPKLRSIALVVEGGSGEPNPDGSIPWQRILHGPVQSYLGKSLQAAGMTALVDPHPFA